MRGQVITIYDEDEDAMRRRRQRKKNGKWHLFFLKAKWDINYKFNNDIGMRL